MQKMMIFIDAEYVIQSLRRLHGLDRKIQIQEIDWQNLITYIVQSRLLVRSYYYTSQLNAEFDLKQREKQDDYLLSLKNTIPSFEIKLGKMIRQQGTWVQKGVDVRIALDMVNKASHNHYDIAALVTGDSDFTDLLGEVKEVYGKKVELYTFDRSDCNLDKFFVAKADFHKKIDNSIAKKIKLF